MSNHRFIVIGAGSAGNVLVNRLTSKSKNIHVTLIESGKSDINRFDSWTISMPSALTFNVADQRYNW